MNNLFYLPLAILAIVTAVASLLIALIEVKEMQRSRLYAVARSARRAFQPVLIRGGKPAIVVRALASTEPQHRKDTVRCVEAA